MKPDTTLSRVESAQLQLLETLDRLGYDFVPVTPATHRRILARPGTGIAADLRDIFGWSLPFRPDDIDPDILALVQAGGLIRPHPLGLATTARISRVRGRLFLHSAFPTDADDSVFLGPDSLRFLNFIHPLLERRAGITRLVDIGAGAGVGGISVAAEIPVGQTELADINLKALRLARVNAANAGLSPIIVESNGLEAIQSGFDVAIANPPFILDSAGPVYRSGGGRLGTEISENWALAAARKLAPGGCVLLYTGSPIVKGFDTLRDALEQVLPALGCSLTWNELDPDIFGEELEKPAYGDVERIAAIGAVIDKIN